MVRWACLRLVLSVVLMSTIQLVGLLVGPMYWDWHWNPLWGGHDDLRVAGTTIVAATIGAAVTTLVLQLRKPPSWPELVLMLGAGVVAFPILVGVLFFAISVSYSMDYACMNSLIGGWVVIFVSVPSFICSQTVGCALQWAVQHPKVTLSESIGRK